MSGQGTRDNPLPFQSPKRHRQRMNSFLSKHHLMMSPQPRRDRTRHRRRANSWHGGNKLIHFFHHPHDKEGQPPAFSPKDAPRLDNNNNKHDNTKDANQKNTAQINEQPSPETELNHNVSTKPMEATHKHAFSHFFKAVEDFLFQRRHPAHHEKHDRHPISHKKDIVLLYGCETVEEHYQKVKDQMELIRPLHGKEGLRAIELEYRMVHCDAHKQCEELVCAEDSDSADDDLAPVFKHNPGALSSVPESSITTSQRSSLCSTVSQPSSSQASPALPLETFPSGGDDLVPDKRLCHWCMQRLFHIPSGLIIDENNRKQFCADGDMYEEVARLCQEYAQDLMCKEANLEWHVVESASENGHKDPIRMMVSKDHPVLKEGNVDGENGRRLTLLIATGRGKVRAGIFSRMHVMCAGLESATAIPMIREAAARHINVIVLDPNVHGDANGFVTFTKCMDHYYHKMNDSLNETGLYVLSHSASGGHMARYLLDKPDDVLAHFHAIAFTDSTHNIQWTKKKPINNHAPRSLFAATKSFTDEQNEGTASPLQEFLESERCVYFRCANVRRDGPKWYIHPAGEPAQTDAFWTHRFGKIRTFWAGTDEHSLTNWYSHAKIWEHFDEYLKEKRQKGPA